MLRYLPVVTWVHHCECDKPDRWLLANGCSMLVVSHDTLSPAVLRCKNKPNRNRNTL